MSEKPGTKSLLQGIGEVGDTFENTLAASSRLDRMLATPVSPVYSAHGTYADELEERLIRGGNTSTKPLALSGTAVAQSDASLFGGDSLPGSSATDTLGLSPYPAVTLAAGSNSFAATATDAQGTSDAASAAPTKTGLSDDRAASAQIVATGDTTARSLSTVNVMPPVTVRRWGHGRDRRGQCPNRYLRRHDRHAHT